MTESAAKDPKNLILVIADMARSNPPMVSSFIAEMTRRLQGQALLSHCRLPGWSSDCLSAARRSSKWCRRESTAGCRSGIHKATASAVIVSGSIDWREFVETMSVVDQTLRKDPGSVYNKMDFSTRDRYRHVVEKIAKHSRFSESEWLLKRRAGA